MILKTKTYSGLKVLCHLVVQGRSEKGQQPKRNKEVRDPAGSRAKVDQSRNQGVWTFRLTGLCAQREPEKNVRHLRMKSREAEVVF